MALMDAKGGIVLLAILAFVLPVRAAPLPNITLDSLELLQLLTRHGNRTPLMPIPGLEAECLKPFTPYQFGQLLPNGRLQVANTGKYIRDRYDSFLPREFNYNAVTAKCTDAPRIQESSAVFLAAIFPAENTSQQWDYDGLGYYWTPIPCQYLPASQDKVLSGDAATCPRYAELYADVKNSKEFIYGVMNVTHDGQINEAIGQAMNLTEPASEDYLMAVFENIIGWVAYHIDLPDWAAPLYPQPAMAIARLHQSVSYFNEEMTRILMGEFLKEIFTTAEQLENNQLPSTLKLVSYVAHDTQIMAMLYMLDLLPIEREPDFGATLIMELHRNQTTSKIGYKFIYRSHSWLDPVTLVVPGCPEICPLEYVKNYVKRYIPTQSHFDYCVSQKS